MRTTIRQETPEEFFQRGKGIARQADAGQPLAAERIIAFEDPSDLARFLTTARITLFREVKAGASSITALAERLHRDRSAVKRDVEELRRYGLVEVEDKPLPGHGRRKEVRASAEQVLLAL